MALVADVKQAFWNKEIDEGDGDFLRFLWVENILEKDKIVLYILESGIWGY